MAASCNFSDAARMLCNLAFVGKEERGREGGKREGGSEKRGKEGENREKVGYMLIHFHYS